MADALQEMKALIEQIERHNYLYYTLDQPSISDKEYDALYDRLTLLESETGTVLPNSPTLRVGHELLKGFDTHRHMSKLWSLDKAQSKESLLAWHTRVHKLVHDYNQTHPDNPLPHPTFVVELKFDGLTLNLTYEGGKLVQAATRGNGVVGEAILPQVKTIKSIPLEIPFQGGRIEVQGEGMMNLSTLQKYNETAVEPLKKRPQCGRGSSAQSKPACHGGTEADSLFFYNIGYSDGIAFENHKQMVDFLKDNRLKVSAYIHYYDHIEDVYAELERIEEIRHTLDFLIDGGVVKVADMRTGGPWLHGQVSALGGGLQIYR